MMVPKQMVWPATLIQIEEPPFLGNHPSILVSFPYCLTLLLPFDSRPTPLNASIDRSWVAGMVNKYCRELFGANYIGFDFGNYFKKKSDMLYLYMQLTQITNLDEIPR